MKDRFILKGPRTDEFKLLGRAKELLGGRSYTVVDYDLEARSLTARKLSTASVVLGYDRELTFSLLGSDPSGPLIAELRWKGMLKGCMISFIELFMLTLIIGRDLGVEGLLLSVLIGSAAALLNMSVLIVQRSLLRKDLRALLSSFAGPLAAGQMLKGPKLSPGRGPARTRPPVLDRHYVP